MPYRKISLGLFFIGMLGWVCILLEERDLYLSANLLFLSFIVFMYNSGSLVIRIRNIFLLKIFVISFVWAYSVLWIGNSIVPVSIPGFISVFLFIVGITIPFDICDMGRDSIQTIPKLLGIKKSKYFACFFLLSSAVLFYLNFPEKTDFVVSWSLACGVSVALVLFMKSKDSYFYTRFWIEACSSFPFILLYLLQKIRAIL
jgi:4-hydroxybenzoate polyprenyltransferase